MITLDHFSLGVSSLLQAIREFELKTGVAPILGGGHPKLGTHNALVSLGDSYFELIAADPNRSASQKMEVEPLRKYKLPKIIGWSLRYNKAEEVFSLLKNCGLNASEVGTGERQDLQGRTLRYEFITISNLPELEVIVPFFVRWVNTIPPSETSPAGC